MKTEESVMTKDESDIERTDPHAEHVGSLTPMGDHLARLRGWLRDPETMLRTDKEFASANWGSEVKEKLVDLISAALSSRPASAAEIVRCDQCDNGIGHKWEYCAWCGQHLAADYPSHEANTVSAPAAEVTEKDQEIQRLQERIAELYRAQKSKILSAMSFTPSSDAAPAAERQGIAERDERLISRLDLVGEYLCGKTDDPAARKAYATLCYIRSTLNLDGEEYRAILATTPSPDAGRVPKEAPVTNDQLIQLNGFGSILTAIQVYRLGWAACHAAVFASPDAAQNDAATWSHAHRDATRVAELAEIRANELTELTDEMLAALMAVEEWWLREGMQHHHTGTPYAIFATRAAIANAKDDSHSRTHPTHPPVA